MTAEGKAPGAGVPVSSLLMLALRAMAGGMLATAAFFKLKDPLTFAEAIMAFKMVKGDHLVMVGTYILPWTELFTGLALILGIWTRAAAFVYCGLMTLFIVVITIALNRGLGGIPCSCFGYLHLYCEGGLGWCKVGENNVLLALGVLVWVFGGGSLSVDALVDRRFKPLA